jgi:hypothetical protein
LKQSDDQTLFAWELGSHSTTSEFCGPLATSPSQFRGCSQLLPLPDPGIPAPYSMTNKGLGVKLPIVRLTESKYLAILPCTTRLQYPARITLPLVLASKHQTSHFARDHKHIGPLGYSHPGSLSQAHTDTIFIIQEPEPSVQTPIEWVAKLRNNWGRGGQGFYAPYFEPELFTYMEIDDGSRKIYHLPPNCHSGAIIFRAEPNAQYHLIILYTINDNDPPGFNYNVVCAVPEQMTDIPTPTDRRFFVAARDVSPFDTKKLISQQCIYETRLDLSDPSEPYDGKKTDFDTKRSIGDFQKEFTPNEWLLHPIMLPSFNSVLVKTDTEYFRNQVTTVLSIELYREKEAVNGVLRDP